jgi:hypothetical protein
MRSAYGAARRAVAPDVRRILVRLTAVEIERIDNWAIAVGKPHRLDALRHLIERGLAAEMKTANRRGSAA